MMQIVDPYEYGAGTYSDGGEDSGITGGTDPDNPPTYKPSGNGWWEFWGGVWHWMTEPAPRTVSKSV